MFTRQRRDGAGKTGVGNIATLITGNKAKWLRTNKIIKR